MDHAAEGRSRCGPGFEDTEGANQNRLDIPFYNDSHVRF
jgi:hypothetical protein